MFTSRRSGEDGGGCCDGNCSVVGVVAYLVAVVVCVVQNNDR